MKIGLDRSVRASNFQIDDQVWLQVKFIKRVRAESFVQDGQDRIELKPRSEKRRIELNLQEKMVE